MTTTWVRSWTQVNTLVQSDVLVASIPLGGTLLRARYGWRCLAATSTLYSAADIMDTQIAIGMLTGFPAGSYAVPNVLTSPGDVAPPTERYLWWETRGLRQRTWGAEFDDVVTYEDTGPVEATDTHSQVKASVPAGDQLGVYLAWCPSRTDFPGAGYVCVSAWWSVLYST